MATVPGAPYQPFTEVAPAERVLHPGGVPAVPDAFGAGIARAVRTFGGDLEEGGKRVFDAAMDLRQMQIETGVRDEATEHFRNIESMHNKFMEAQGDEAGPDAMNAHLAQIDDLRKQAREKVAQKYGMYGATKFDADTASMERSFIREASAHSWQQMKASHNASIETRAEALRQQVEGMPDDEEGYNAAAGRMRELSNEKSRGLDPETVEYNATASVSALTSRRIMGKALKGDDEGAQTMLDQAIKSSEDAKMGKKTILPEDAEKVQQALTTQAHRNASFRSTQETHRRQMDREEAETGVNTIESRNLDTDSNGQLVINPKVYKELTDFARANPHAGKFVNERLNFIEHQQDLISKGITVQTNPDAMSQLTGNMFNPTNPTSQRDLAIAQNNNLLSPRDAKWIKGTIDLRNAGDKTALNDPIFKMAAASAKLQIEGTSALQRVANAGLYASFQYQFLQRYLDKVREHKLEPGDLDMSNPDGFLRKTMEEFKIPVGAAIRNNGGVGAVPTKLPPPTVAPATPKAAPKAEPERPAIVTNRKEFDAVPAGKTFIWRQEGKPDKQFTKPPEGKGTKVELQPGQT